MLPSHPDSVMRDISLTSTRQRTDCSSSTSNMLLMRPQTPTRLDAKANQQNPGLRKLRAEEGGEENWRVRPDHT
jgi:hypothetical protein